MTKKKFETKDLVMSAIFTAIVLVLQMLGSFVKFGPFSISLVLVPIVIGAAVCGKGIGAWLGFVFSVAVLATDSGAFLAVNPMGTVVTVLLKGTLAGFVAGYVYRLISRKNVILAVFVAALLCPIVNTGIFMLGCKVFFMETLTEWASAAGFADAASYIIYGMVGANFLFEVLFNVILSPIIVRLINIGKK